MARASHVLAAKIHGYSNAKIMEKLNFVPLFFNGEIKRIGFANRAAFETTKSFLCRKSFFSLTKKSKAHWQNQRGKRGGITRTRNPRSGVCLEFLIVFTLTKNQSGHYEVIRATFEFIKTPALRRGLCLRAACKYIKNAQRVRGGCMCRRRVFLCVF